MEEFLRENYYLLTKSVEILAAVTGLIYYKKYKVTVVKYFVWFLVYVAILELIGGYPRYVIKYDFLNEIGSTIKGTLFEKNYWYYTVFWTIGSALFYSFFYRKILKNKRYTRVIKYLSILFLASSILYVATHWIVFFNSTISYINIFGAILIILCVILYFIEILQTDRILLFYKSIEFYISFILLVWWLVITPLVFYNIYYSTADGNFIFLKREIYLFANIFMYGSFAIALIWCKPQNNL